MVRYFLLVIFGCRKDRILICICSPMTLYERIYVCNAKCIIRLSRIASVGIMIESLDEDSPNYEVQVCKKLHRFRHATHQSTTRTRLINHNLYLCRN